MNGNYYKLLFLLNMKKIKNETENRDKRMNKVREKVSSGKRLRFLTILLTAALLTTACGGGGLTSEQLRVLEETKEAALSAEKKVQSQKRERKDLNEDLAVKKAELKKLLEEKEVLMERFQKIQELNRDETEADRSNVEEKIVGESENGGNN